MIKSIFVPLNGMDGDRAALSLARTIAQSFGAKISGAHVRLDVNSALALATRETSWRAEREENERSTNARAAFDQVFGAKDSATVNAHWREIEGFPLYEYAFHGRMHDLIVIARERPLPEYAAEILMRTGRPVLIAPPRATEMIGESVLLAWNNSPESARALTAAMPMLRKAKKVLIACIPQAVVDGPETQRSLDELRDLLVLHGLSAETRLLKQAQDNEANMLRDAAYGAGCDLIVMGGYGHSRLREYVFGGATRAILNECALPVFMFH
jgi:nucleotide-binding universal stress UspA family protein